MRRLAAGLLVSLLTFGIGVVITFAWIVPYFRPPAVCRKKEERPARPAPINCPGREPIIRDRVSGAIVADKKSPWEPSATTLGGREDLRVVHFFDANRGWVGGSKGALYKTTDAGRTWHKIKLDVPPDSKVWSISFVNPSVGWVAVSRLGNTNTEQGRDETHAWVLHTSDGGKSWHTQYQGKALRVFRVQFVNEREGWAAGDRIDGYLYDGFLIHTTDGGETWTDLSATAAKHQEGNVDIVVNVLAAEPSRALILQFSGDFFSTDDGGNSWRQVAALPKEPPQAFLGEIKIAGENRMWAVGGADSIEGMWGTLARMDTDCSWTRYSIGGVNFNDAAFPSENDWMVCGTIPTRGQGRGLEGRGRDGVILRSSDGGRNWAIIYRDRAAAAVNALAVADANNVWAVGQAGRVIHLRPASAGPEN